MLCLLYELCQNTRNFSCEIKFDIIKTLVRIITNGFEPSQQDANVLNGELVY